MPNRVLKESIRESESIDQLSAEAERTWYRLITYVDDYGLFKANVRLINRALYPLKDFKDSNVERWLDEIAAAGMLAFYTGDDGKPYGTILHWETHNKPRNSKPKYPQPPESANLYTQLSALANNCMQADADENNPEQLSKVRARTRERSSIRSSSRSSDSPASECKQKQTGKYPPPSLDEVVKYFQDKGYSAEAAKKAWEYYEAGKDPTSGNWKDAHGNIVKAWKQKMISVWFKPENKATASTGKSFDPEEERKRLEDALS